MYVWMDADFNQYEVEATNMGDAINYLEDGMEAEVVFYDGKAISCELPTSVEREITWTEPAVDRKSTRLNSSHLVISYAVFCLKKKKQTSPIAHPLLKNTHVPRP